MLCECLWVHVVRQVQVVQVALVIMCHVAIAMCTTASYFTSSTHHTHYCTHLLSQAIDWSTLEGTVGQSACGMLAMCKHCVCMSSGVKHSVHDTTSTHQLSLLHRPYTALHSPPIAPPPSIPSTHHTRSIHVVYAPCDTKRQHGCPTRNNHFVLHTE